VIYRVIGWERPTVVRSREFRLLHCTQYRSTQIFGEEQTKEEADERSFKGGVSFWTNAANYIKDGELLHIAVQVGSLLGVNRTSWPAMIKWKDEKIRGRTAIQFSTEKWGSDHPITQFLRNETCSLFTTENIQ